MANDDNDPETTLGRGVKRVSENASEIASQAVGMGLFIGLLLASGVLLLLREADLVSFNIPDGLLAVIVLVALVVAAGMDTSIVPDE